MRARTKAANETSSLSLLPSQSSIPLIPTLALVHAPADSSPAVVLTFSFISGHRLASPFAPSRRAFSSTPAIARDPISVPDFSKYRASSVGTNRNLSYFMIGSLGMLTAAASKASVVDLIGTLSASADVLALAKIEVAMGSIPEGKNVVLKWRGKPVFIRHRTQSEIDEANAVDVGSLRDPQEDSARTQQPEWSVQPPLLSAELACSPVTRPSTCTQG